MRPFIEGGVDKVILHICKRPMVGMIVLARIEDRYVEIIDFMQRIKPVFSLTKLSYVAALATLQDKEFIEYSIEKGIESREYLYNEISRMKKVNVLKSYSNYMAIDLHDSGFTAAEISREFMKRGMIVRDCTSFKGLDEYWIRISICTLEEDKKFIEAMKEILGEE